MNRFSFFKRKNSGNLARERLKQLLFHDRVSLSVDLTDRIQKDLIRSIRKYIEVDEKDVTVVFEKNKETQAFLMQVTIPVTTLKTRR